MEIHKCQYCGNGFTTLSVLKNHQKRTKYCIELQKKNNIDVIEDLLKCDYCLKFYNPNLMKRHLETCKIRKIQIVKKESDYEIEKLKIENQKNIEDLNNKIKDKDYSIYILQEKLKEKEFLSRDLLYLEKQIDEYKKNNIDLQNRIERILNRAIDKPSLYSNGNTKIVSLQSFDLSKDYVTNKVMNKFNDNHILDGMSGIAKFVKDKIITLEDGSLIYACFDTARQIFKYKDKDGNVIKDPKSVKLIEMIQPALKEQTTNLYNFFENEIELCEENGNDTNEIISKVDKMKFLKDSALKIRVEINEMHENNKFSNELSNMIS